MKKKIKEVIKPYKIYDFNCYQLKEIENGLKNELTEEQIKVYANPEFNENQMYEIRTGFEKGLSIKQVKLYADPKLYIGYMRSIKDNLILEIPVERIRDLLEFTKKYHIPNMDNVLTLLKMGISISAFKEEIKKMYEKEGIIEKYKVLEIIIKLIKERKFEPDFNDFINKTNLIKNKIDNEFLSIESFITFFYLYKMSRNIPLEITDKLIDYLVFPEDVEYLYNLTKKNKDIGKLFYLIINNYGEKIEKTDIIYFFNDYEKIGFENLKFILKNIEKYNDVFNAFKLIKEMFLFKIPINKIEEIIKESDNVEKLKKKSFLTIKEKFRNILNKITDNKTDEFDFNQIKEIVEGIIDGLTVEQIKAYADKDLDSLVMGDIKELIKEKFLSIEDIKNIIKIYKREKRTNAYINYLDLKEEIKHLYEILYFYTDFSMKEIEQKVMQFFQNFYKKNLSVNAISENIENMEKYLRKCNKEKIPKEYIKIALNPAFNEEIRDIIIKYYKRYNLTPKQIKLMIFIKFKIPIEVIKNIELKKENGKNILILKDEIDENIIKQLKEKLKINEMKKEEKGRNIEI